MSDNIGDNLSNSEHWLRALFTVIYGFIFWLCVWGACLVTVLNLLILLITGQRNGQLTEFGEKLADYMHQVLRYATQASVQRPFPFSEDAPASASAGADVSTPVPSAAATPAPKAKPADPEEKPAPKPAAKKKKTKPRKKKATKKVSSDTDPTS